MPLPPSRSMLQRAVNGWTAFAKSGPGFGLGSYTLKTLGGVMIGLGIVACLGGGAGLPLIIAGAVIWAFATSVSVTALEDKTPGSVALDLLASLVCVTIGAGMGCMGLMTPTGPYPGLVKYVWAMGGLTGSVFPVFMDKCNLEDRLNRDPLAAEALAQQNLQARVDQAVINLAARDSRSAAETARQNALPRVDSIVLGDLQTAYRKQGERIILHKGNETIHLVIDHGQDCISFANLIPAEEPDLGLPAEYNGETRGAFLPHVWVALRQSAAGVKPAVYTLHQKSSVCSSDGALLPGLTHHPITRVALTASGSILENRELLKWLDPEFTDDDHVPAASN